MDPRSACRVHLPAGRAANSLGARCGRGDLLEEANEDRPPVRAHTRIRPTAAPLARAPVSGRVCDELPRHGERRGPARRPHGGARLRGKQPRRLILSLPCTHRSPTPRQQTSRWRRPAPGREEGGVAPETASISKGPPCVLHSRNLDLAGLLPAVPPAFLQSRLRLAGDRVRLVASAGGGVRLKQRRSAVDTSHHRHLLTPASPRTRAAMEISSAMGRPPNPTDSISPPRSSSAPLIRRSLPLGCSRLAWLGWRHMLAAA